MNRSMACSRITCCIPLKLLRTQKYQTISFARRASSEMSSRKDLSGKTFTTKREAVGFRTRTLHEMETIITRSSKKNKKNPEMESFEAALICVPKEINEFLHRSTEDDKKSRQFVLLTKSPVLNLHCLRNGTVEELTPANKMATGIELNFAEREIVDAFVKTPLYQWLFSNCSNTLWKSEFWTSSIFLPCWMKGSGDWTIAWDVIKMYISTEARNADIHQLVSEIGSFGDIDFGECNDIEDFLKQCGAKIHKEGHELLFNLTRKTKKNAMRLEGINSRALRNFIREAESTATEALDPIEPGTQIDIFAMSASWVSIFFLAPFYVSKVVQYIDAWRMKQFFSVENELSVTELTNSLSVLDEHHLTEFKKFVTLGTLLLRLIFLLDRSQSSDFFSISNSKKESNDTFLNIRNVVVAGKLLDMEPVLDMFFSRTGVSGSLIKSNVKSQLYQSLTKLNIEDLERLALEGYVYDAWIDNLGQNFKAFLAICHLKGGMSVSWSILERLGLVERNKDSHLSVCIDGWKTNKRSVYSKKRKWEVKRGFDTSYFPKVFEKYSELRELLGYDFNQRYRLYCALVHPSSPFARPPFYGWLVVFGKAYLDLFYQVYSMEHRPEWDQPFIGRHFNDKAKLNACVNVGISLELPFIGVHDVYNLINIMKNLTKDGDLEILRTDQTASNYVATMMQAVVGSLAYDSGFSLNTVFPVLARHFGVEILKSSEISLAQYVLVRRYVPTFIESSLFEVSNELLPNQYFSTLVKCVREGEEDGFFGFYVLTKKRIPDMDRVESTTFEEIQTLAITFESKDDSLTLESEYHESLLKFQTMYFDPIFPPETKMIPIEDQTKKYLILPAIKKTERNWDIDWDMVHHIGNKTAPDMLVSLIKETNKLDLDTIEGIIKSDQQSEFSAKSTSAENSFLVEALKRLVLVTSSNQVLSMIEVNQGDDNWIGKVTNQQCMQDVLFISYSSSQTQPKYVTFGLEDLESGSVRVLPYTLSYFNCISTIPYILSEFESKLLAEDYRNSVSLPSSFSNSEVLRGLTSPRDKDFFVFSKLEFLGTAVLLYLQVLELVLENPGVSVGELATKKSTILKADINLSSKHDTELLLGHLNFYQFSAYRKDAPWHPPSVAPFILKSTYDTNEETTKNNKQKEVSEIEGDEQRVQSSLQQKMPILLANKHFKAIAALCFMKDGIEAACEYYSSVDILKMKKYPDADIASIDDDGLEERQGFDKYNELEEIIGYEFKDVSLLAQVFMHSSLFKNKNNEILEFLGDATVELSVAQFLHEEYFDASIGETFDMKISLICNNTLAWVSLSEPLRLPYYLMHVISDFEDAIKPEKRSKTLGLESKNATKICSDVFEALIGAVLIDSGYSFDTARKVVIRLLKDVLENMPEYEIGIPSE
eukprot:g9110.t1